MTCILCDKPLKTLRKITWQKMVCNNDKCKYYMVGDPDPVVIYHGVIYHGIIPSSYRVYIHQDGRSYYRDYL